MGDFLTRPALLALENGNIFHGRSIGAEGFAVGEVVFNTAMTGYQEILTDPSYARQMVTLTYPHIGNTGINNEDAESSTIYAHGLIIRDLPNLSSNFRKQLDLSSYLKNQKIIGIADIDTRKLTRILREQGAQSGCIMAGNIDIEKALFEAKNFSGLQGMDLAQVVSTTKSYQWRQGSWQLDSGLLAERLESELKYKIVAYDYGIKTNILRMLVDRACDITVVPAKTSAETVLAMQPDGIFLSNGPGDPAPCDYAISAIKIFLAHKIPLFGICLGHQLLALAAGAQTMKMKFGHHGANHPVQDLVKDKVMITSQNHGFTVDETSLPAHIKITHRSLFDGSLQGIHLLDSPAFSFQGHPEASPGPHDAADLFDHFIELMAQRRS